MSKKIKINLRKYQDYSKNVYFTVEKKVAKVLEKSIRDEDAYQHRKFYKKEWISIDALDNNISSKIPSIEDAYNKYMLYKELYIAINILSSIQKKRLYQYYFLEMSYKTIANIENTSRQSIEKSIQCSVKKLQNYFIENKIERYL